jgi:D-alanine-D-alanine ligase
MDEKLSIIVLGGGLSEEREVSLSSARAIYETLKKQGRNVSLIDPATGRSLIGPDGKLIEDKNRSSSPESGTFAIEKSLQTGTGEKADLVFLALHGGAGENGTIQAMLDLAGIKYTGSGQLASAAAMNKAFTKKLVTYENIPTPKWRLLRVSAPSKIGDFGESIESEFDLPFIVKPNDSGSTVGLTLIKDYGQLSEALTAAASVSGEILIEEYIKGREITAAVLDGEAFPLVEIKPSGELYDYHCKYTEGGSQYVCPAEIPEKIADRIRNYALTAYKVIKCSGLARVDFILEDNKRPYFLEVNTLPGMTALSLAPMAAAAAGIDFDQLMDRIIKCALKK